MPKARLAAERDLLSDRSGRQEVKDLRHVVDIAKWRGVRAQIPEQPLGIGEVNAIDEWITVTDSAGISEQLIFKTDLNPAVAVRAGTIDSVYGGVAGEIAKESVAAIRLDGRGLAGFHNRN